MGSLRLAAADLARLAEGALAFGLSLDTKALSRFETFSELLTRWSASGNLISCRGPAELVERHLLDSLALSPLLSDADRIVDLGSGGGFPGVPLAIAHPLKAMNLVEPRRRRANFLREVRRKLPLTNVEVMEARAETPGALISRADIALSRAVWANDAILAIAGHWVRVGGTLLWMRARPGSSTRRELHPGSYPMRFEGYSSYRIGKGQPRCVEIFRKGSDEEVDSPR